MLERVSGRALGYETEQVDALLDRVRRQYENPKLRFVTASMLTSMQFEMAPGGYRVDQVDEALAQVADDFERRDVEGQLARIGKRAMAQELAAQLEQIRQVLERDPDKRFSPARAGFNKQLVRQLLSEIKVENGKLLAPETKDMLTRPLGRGSGGPSRVEVNEFTSLVIGAKFRQELLS